MVSVVEQPEPDPHSAPPPSGQAGQRRVRELLRDCGTARNQDERATVLVKLATELTGLADDITADHDRARRYPELIAGLRGQADMARLAAVLEQCHEHHRAG